MDWLKISLFAPEHLIDAVCDYLRGYGINGFEIINKEEMNAFLIKNPFNWDYVDESLLSPKQDCPCIIFYEPDDCEGLAHFNKIKTNIYKELFSDFEQSHDIIKFDVETLNDSSWLNEWKKYFHPFRIGKSIIIVPAWYTFKPDYGDLVFNVDPGSAFGTGQHQSTKLCIELMEKFIKPGDILLDIGCGSGILFIIGLLLGAKHALACDFDPAAASSVSTNTMQNNIEPHMYTYLSGDIFNNSDIIEKIKNNKYDIIVANIVADAIIQLATQVIGYLKPGGVFIASGIICERGGDVVNAFINAGYKKINSCELDGWLAVYGLCNA